jgi:hypothetical protein
LFMCHVADGDRLLAVEGRLAPFSSFP